MQLVTRVARRAGSLGWLLLVAMPSPAQDRPPVILISIDTLRADHLSAYGYTAIKTPNFDAFAQGGTLFSEVSSQIPLTLPSHTSLFTSTYPFENGIEENSERVAPGVVTLAGVLQSHGYKTAAFVGSVLLDRRLGLDQGFDFYDSPFSLQMGAAESPYSVRVRRGGALVLRAARQWLEANHGRPAFVFIHLFDLHTPYSMPARPGLSGYDTAIEAVDAMLGGFRQTLVQGGWWDRSVIVLLSDHGESLGDHGEASHGYFVYQSTLHVPLIIHWPGAIASLPARSTAPGGLIDVAPTILDFLKIPAPPSFEGTSLLGPGNRNVASESVYARDAFRWAPLHTIRAGAYQYIDAPKPELYNLAQDPHEQTNLAAREPAEASRLRAQLADLMARHTPKTRSPSDVSGEMRALLGSLGYAAGSSRGAVLNAPDPKDRLSEYNLYEKALGGLYSANPAAAVAGFRELLAKDPDNTLARYYMGEAWLRAGKPDDAAHAWTDALAHDPRYVPAAEALGAMWLARGDRVKARQYLEQALAMAPDDYPALVELGIIEKAMGETEAARRHLEAACKIALDPAPCRKELESLDKPK